MAKVTPLPPESRGDIGRQQDRMQDDSGEASPQTVGQCLRSVRLSRGEDLKAVSRTLRIRSDHIEAIEENRLDDLPGRTYAVGFVRSYAGHLGLDPAEYVARLKGEIAGHNEQSPLKGLPEDTGESRLPYGWLIMALVVVGVVGYAGYQLVRSADLPAVQAVAPVPAAIRPEPARRAPAPKRTGHAQQATLRPGPGGGSGAVNPALAAGTVSMAGTLAAPTNPAWASLPQGQVFGAQNREARVVLHARAVTHLLVEGPGGRVYINRILHPGDVYRVPDLVGLSLTAPDGGAILVELDGQDMGVAGRGGQLTEALSLDPQAIVDRTHRGKPG